MHALKLMNRPNSCNKGWKNACLLYYIFIVFVVTNDNSPAHNNIGDTVYRARHPLPSPYADEQQYQMSCFSAFSNRHPQLIAKINYYNQHHALRTCVFVFTNSSHSAAIRYIYYEKNPPSKCVVHSTPLFPLCTLTLSRLHRAPHHC